MGFELFIALRYLRAKRKQTFISVISVFSVVGIALGVTSLIVAMGIMNGFTRDLRDKILEANSEIIIYSLFGGMDNVSELREKISPVEGVKSVTPFIYTELMISAPGGVKGLMLRGVDPETAPESVTLLTPEKLEKGSIDGLIPPLDAEDTTPGIIIGKHLAEKILRVDVGSRVNLIAPSGRRSSAGFSPKVMPFKIAGIFSTGMINYDSTLAFVSLDSARDLVGMPYGRVSGIELKTTDIFKADKTATAVQKVLGNNYRVDNWMETNANVFAALKLEKLAMGIVLTIIVLVASFSVFTTLIMMVMEKTRDIAVLMSLGATKESIGKIFKLQGMIICTLGTVIGFVLGISLSFLLKKYEFIKLPEGVYPSNHVPMLIQGQDLALIVLGTFIICALATIYPARQASKLTPAEALHFE